jgi:hypothetical protein
MYSPDLHPVDGHELEPVRRAGAASPGMLGVPCLRVAPTATVSSWMLP